MKAALLSLFLLLHLLLLGQPGYAQQTAPPFDFSTAVGAIAATGDTEVYQIVPASNGGYYLTGSFGGTVALGQFTLTAAGAADVFVAKVDAAGTYQWVVRAGGIKSDIGKGLGVDGAGNVYVTGTFQSTQAAFGPVTLSHNCDGCDQTFVAKLSPLGTWLWAIQTTNTWNYGFAADYATSLALDAAGNSYICGQFTGQKLALGTLTLTNSDPSLAFNQSGQPDWYVAKLSPAGTWLWAVSGGGTNADAAASIALDPAGNVYVTGAFESTTAKFGTTTLTNSGYTNAVVAKLDGAGNWLWVARGGGPAYCYPTSIAVDASGQAYIAGQFTSATTFGVASASSAGYYDAFVAKLGPTGTWQWVNRCGGSAADRAYSLALDSQGSAYIAGHFLSATMAVGATPLVNPVANRLELFAAKLDAQGNWQWAVQAEGDKNGSNIAYSLALDNLGRIWLAGYFEGAYAQFGTNTVAGNPGQHSFMGYVARLGNQVLATQPPSLPTGSFTLAPNPTQGPVWLHDLAAGQTVQLYDMMGRLLATRQAPASGPLLLAPPAALAPGLYLVQSGGQRRRLVVE